MKNTVVLKLLFELLWFIFAGIAAYLLILPIKHEISQPFFVYLASMLFLIVTYFRFIAFLTHSIFMDSVWVKIALFVLNIPLFFWALNQYFTFNAVFDEYNYTLPATIFQHIKSGTEVNDLMYIKQLTIFSGIIAMMLIIVLELRIVQAMFRYRQLDKFL